MPESKRKPVAVGDLLSDGSTVRTVLGVLPYIGKYPAFFNVVLVLSSPVTLSGKIEMAYNDLALRGGPSEE